MGVIKRLFIVIWTIVYFCITLCGGFFLIPLLAYIFAGKCNDMMETISEIWAHGKYLIEDFFDNLSNIKCKKNGEFWK